MALNVGSSKSDMVESGEAVDIIFFYLKYCFESSWKATLVCLCDMDFYGKSKYDFPYPTLFAAVVKPT